MKKIWIWLKISSDWIDNRFFPVEKKLETIIEESANELREKLSKCRNINDLYHVYELINEFKQGGGVQAKSWSDSLLIDFANKEKEFLINKS